MEFPRRRSTEETLADRARLGVLFNNNLDSDFNDVFGGPPRSMMSHKIYGNNFSFLSGNPTTTNTTTTRSPSSSSSSSNNLYEDVFRSSVSVLTEKKKKKGKYKNERSLPVLSIPGMAARRGGRNKRFGFYDDIFGRDEDSKNSCRRSESKTKGKVKSNGSPVLSVEDVMMRGSCSPSFDLRPQKLRPIKVPSRPNTSPVWMEEHEAQQVPLTVPWDCPLVDDFELRENDFNEIQRSSQYRFSRGASSPETISFNLNSYQSLKVSADDLETTSSPSVVSSFYQEREKSENKSGTPKTAFGKQDLDEKEQEENEQADCVEEQTSSSGSEEEKRKEDEKEQEQEEEDKKVLSSYVIEITRDKRSYLGESLEIDETIAWLKEKLQTQSLDGIESIDRERPPDRIKPFMKSEDFFTTHENMKGRDRTRRSQFQVVNEIPETWNIADQLQQFEEDEVDLDLLKESIMLWSAGREENVRSLLSSLHDILWTDSGWSAIPLTKLIQGSQVKKAYQKARLCLHPDKLQQRGATPPQKYIAEEVFAILQDAWDSFVARDVLF